MDDAELTSRVVAASGPQAVDDLITFMRKRIAEDRRMIDSVDCPVTTGPQHQIGIGGGTTALVPLGRFSAHLNAVERLVIKYEVAMEMAATAQDLDLQITRQRAATAYMDAIKLHALEYATHPDYKENWRP
ncbi:DUF6221 family protein [Streptomyces scabiei]|uniref:DUF6221 family protein n=1 Tax=Streptomyces scabiei TaxID=1930 RepID=UPI0029A91A17|nr:DUF6221 family protein [Streptomyces scabiei]MDX2800187.1 DUF6221 family protein [Streptomyces scabiei]MDX3126956.1 DUF6221 family protein [Streptomyces scabiei]